MFPIATNLKAIRTPWATYAIIGTNVFIHLSVTWNTHWQIPDETALAFGFVPARFGDLSTAHTLITCMFLHGDLIHLSGNMVFLLVFGKQVETDFDSLNFLVLYFTAGITACLVHALVESHSTAPLIGASGAISAILGAFLISNPKARLTFILEPMLIYFLRRVAIRLPAWVFLLGWFFLQLGLALKSRSSNIAFSAHVGGYLAGAVITSAIHKYIPANDPEPTSSDRTC